MCLSCLLDQFFWIECVSCRWYHLVAVSLNGDASSGGAAKERYALYEYCISFILCIFILRNTSNSGFGRFIDSSLSCNTEAPKSTRNLKPRKRLPRTLTCPSDHLPHTSFSCESWVSDSHLHGSHYLEIQFGWPRVSVLLVIVTSLIYSYSIDSRETFRKEFKAANPDVKGVTAVRCRMSSFWNN